MAEQDFISIFYPPGFILGDVRSTGNWTSEQVQVLTAAGFPPHQSYDSFLARDLSTGEIRVARGSPEFDRVQEIFRSLQVEPAERVQATRVPRVLAEYDFYGASFGNPCDGFEEEDIFEQELACLQPPPEGPSPGPRGCGFGKRQVRKLRLRGEKVSRPKADIMPVWTKPNCQDWRLLVISRRVYELFMTHQITGVEYRPVLNAKRMYSPDELSYDYVTPQQFDEAAYVQMSIVTFAAPVPLQGVVDNKPCAQCGWWNGPELKSVDSYVWTRNQLKTVDIQVAAQYRLPDGQVIQKKGHDQVILSSRVLDLLVTNRIAGFSRKGSSFGPLYILPSSR